MSRAENVLNEWESSYGMDELPDHWATKARIAELRAAIKGDLAEVWDEGYDAGHRDARAVGDHYPNDTPNPYRSDHAAQ